MLARMKNLLRYVDNQRWKVKLSAKRGAHIEGGSCVRRSEMGESVRIGKGSNVQGSTIGAFTYLGENCELPMCEIGSFCSIAASVKLAAGNHPKENVSTSPYTFIGRNSFDSRLEPRLAYSREYCWIDSEKSKVCKIGSDVWIGAGALLVSGGRSLSIGTGAIVAAGSVVVRDVRPYEIVGGAPAKTIGWRFSEDERERLLATRWWERDVDWINDRMSLMDDVGKFIDSTLG